MGNLKLLKIFKLFLIVMSIVITGCQDDSIILETQQNDKLIENEELINFGSTPIEGQYIIALYGESSAKKS
jgi:hypothetical protein